MIKYGKPCADVLTYKDSFFLENTQNQQRSRHLFQVYSEQPKKETCRICNFPLEGSLFSKEGVDYIFCKKCDHLNGANQDTDSFCKNLYTEDTENGYASNYSASSAEAYKNRVRDIYQPKAKFLREALIQGNNKPEELSFADLGAGSGHFVYALRSEGLKRSTGYEVSNQQVKLANTMCGPDSVKLHDLANLKEIVSSLDTDVISMISVLEHLQNPREILEAIQENSQIKYLYFSVPLFSPSVFFESVFADFLSPRHLAPSHTNLFTEKSIDYFCQEFGFNKESEWWFGSDMIDLFRGLWLKFSADDKQHELRNILVDRYKPMIDDLQLVLDKKHFGSEVHMLLKCR